MKTFTLPKLLGIAISALSLFIFNACEDKVEVTQRYTIYEPVYMTLSEVRDAFEVSDPVTIERRGKIYLYKQYILLNELGKGIHIIDNANPENPQQLNFINVPGNFDMAVRGDILYADSFLDLLVIDISDLNDIRVIHRMEDIFMDYGGQKYVHPELGLLVDHKTIDVVEVSKREVGHEEWPQMMFVDDLRFFVSTAMSDAAFAMPESAAPSSTGIGGSMATFTIVNDNLYILDNPRVIAFDISNLLVPSETASIDLAWGIETIFPYKENLFVGAQDGMYILDNSNPDNPALLSTFTHISSCDPVVVQDDRAYVTLRSGNACQGFNNQLEVVDISNLQNPKLIKTYPMTNPHGLGIDESTLFICEGTSGLKVFDAADELNIDKHLVLHRDDFDAYDVIPFNNILYLIGNDGLFQFDYTNRENIVLLSELKFNPAAPGQ